MMRLVYHEPPEGPKQEVEGLEARAVARRALQQIGQDLDDLAEMMPEAIDTIREEKRKLRRRAVDAMHRGEHVATRIDSEGLPLGGMIIAKMYEVVGIIHPDGTVEKLDEKQNPDR